MERKADTVSDRTTSQWRVKVNGGVQVGVRPGESLEIGRRPLRPLPDTGVARLEVEDSAKSMSKRHALLTVTADGDALLRDLNSTNGSYVVNADGELMRLPAGRDFPLPTSPIRLQFGDVPIDFVRVDQSESDVKPFTPHVPNLFDYSSPTAAHQEPDAADMSVADILDLRAGEPTAAFAEQSVRPAMAPILPLADALAPASDDIAPADDIAPVSGAVADPMPLHLGDHHSDPAPRDLFADAANAEPEPEPEPAVAADAVIAPAVTPESAVTSGTEPTVTSDPAPAAANVVSAIGSTPAAANAAPVSDPVVRQPADNTVPMGTETVQPTVQTAATQPTVQPAVQPTETTQQPTETTQPAEFLINQTVVSGDTPVSAFTHEPGSVFEKVSNGDFDQPQPDVIEVGGYTSEDARRTSDMTKQFEMARHRELLPFLAMNPSLYDDLYAWLAAQGNDDIDEALSHNEGYRDYREAIGK